jgi:fermentation-respiration switch protein FrsA (DUF1100 family)
MITDAIFAFFATIASFVVGLLPSMNPPDISSHLSALGPVLTWFGWANQYVPLDQVVIVLGIALGAWVTLNVFNGVVWVLTKAHILGGQ